MTLRVSLDTSAVPRDPRGAGRYVIELAAALTAQDQVELTVVCATGDRQRWTVRTSRATVVDRAPRSRPLRLAWEQLRLPQVLRDLAVDVHHGPHYTMPERARLPRVVTIHDLTYFDHPEWHERSKVIVFRRAMRVAARRAAAAICVSELTAERFRSFCRPSTPVHVVPHGVDHDRFRPLPTENGTDERARSTLTGLGVQAPYVAFVGTIEPRKDVAALVMAFDRIAAMHPDHRLVIAGGAGWGVRSLADAVAASSHRARIVQTGYLDDAVLPALLRGATAVAYPSREEGFGLPALEAMACGAPLVTTSGTAMQEVVGDAALLVRPGDVDALAQALDEVLAGGAAVEARRQRGFAVAGAYTWPATAAAHAAVYESVAREAE